jgi:parvulin-like peptidyl-prolyl isomerase
VAAFPSRAEGEGFLARVRGGGAFEGRDLGFVLPADLDARFAEAIRGLKAGEVSGVVETEKGCFVFKRVE